ncbi:effector binding domain-containing protein [Paenibacillus sp. YN15]|uniref:AraC family transcriptional regulator n=1 Tax=Paenibacillus sp. YN15 TaxID=1742774 RepID=UPI002852F0D2|nr:effector binding domain-containing protein [Paenibacillus sp. YN15]
MSIGKRQPEFIFCRIFAALVGTPIMAYVTRRKLEFALYDLSQGRKVIDVAMDYGFGTHAGFTKAFKKCFGYPPSLFHMHVSAQPPGKPAIGLIQSNIGGMKNMHVQIVEKESFLVVGFESRHTMPQVKRVSDIPAFWNTLSLEFGPLLSRLHHTFTLSEHCEYSVCYNVDESTGEFSWLLGVGVDNREDLGKIEADMRQKEMPGGLYAVFTTPRVPEQEYPQSIADTWREILTKWLPDSPYEYDESRLDFERYDERDHAWLHEGTCQMEIAIPVRKRS